MAIWLWINGLEAAGKNDWITVGSFAPSKSRPYEEVVLTIEPRRFYARLVQWSVRAKIFDAFVFIDPQLQIHYHDAMISSFSSARNADKGEIAVVGLNFQKQTSSYSGGP